MFPVTILFLSFIIWACWRLYFRQRFLRTVLDVVPGPPGQSWITGSLDQLTSHEGWEFHRHIAETYGPIIRIKGLFGANNLYVYDPRALYHIFVKDQFAYEETDQFIEINRLFFGPGILATLGEDHRKQRKMLNPVFSISHMRNMTPIFYAVAHKLQNTLQKKLQNGPEEIDIIHWTTRLALELIGQSGLGYSFDDLEEDSILHPYVLASKKLTSTVTPSAIRTKIILPIILRLGTPHFRRFLVENSPLKSIRDVKALVDIFHNTSVEIYEAKKHAFQQGNEELAAQIEEGKDVISILMRANMMASEEEKLSDTELLAQINSLTFAATDTTSGALARTLHLLALHKDVQTKVRHEIRQARKESGGEDIPYDTLVSLPYLDAICRETLRLYPPVSQVERTVRQDIILPLSSPIKGTNGQDLNELHVPNGTDIIVSILASNRNPALWGLDSEEWKPERWLNPLPQSILEAQIPGVYSHLMTFIGGGRSCIGFKFSQLEMKVVLALLLEKFEFSLSEKPIIWLMTGIATPHINRKSKVPRMPMIVKLAN